MRGIPIALMVLIAPSLWAQDGSVTVPWAEFKSLYTERIEQSLRPEEEREKEALYSIDTAKYELALHKDSVQGLVTLEGRVLEGDPDAIPAFANDIAVTDIDQAQGATLIGDADGYRLHFDTEDRFRLAVRIAAPLLEEHSARRVGFRIPSAVTNTLYVQLPDGWRLLEPPGLPRADGGYALPPAETIGIRLGQVLAGTEEALPAVDTFSSIELKGDKYLVTTWFAPAGPGIRDFRVNLPAGSRLLDTSLNASRLKSSGPGTLAIAVPRDWRRTLEMRFELTVPEEVLHLRLPSIQDNVGREGDFALLQPEDGRISLAGSGYRRNLPPRSLPEGLRKKLRGASSYIHAAQNAELELALSRFDAVATPEIVLETVDFHTSFTNNGRALSTLRVELPPEAGDRLILAAVPGAEIWSLRVNGKSRQLYSQSGKHWVVPLNNQGPSLVELAYLSRGAPLGLKGRLELAIPSTGLAAKNLHVAVGLAEQVELVAMEGELLPARKDRWPDPPTLAGTAYHFVHPFYRGEAMTAAVYYKEPLNPERRNAP